MLLRSATAAAPLSIFTATPLGPPWHLVTLRRRCWVPRFSIWGAKPRRQFKVEPTLKPRAAARTMFESTLRFSDVAECRLNSLAERRPTFFWNVATTSAMFEVAKDVFLGNSKDEDRT